MQWILDTCTDTDTITAAVSMVPEIEWPDDHDVASILVRLNSHLFACFDSVRQLLPLTEARAVACLKAITHLWFERGLRGSLRIYSDAIWFDGHFYSISDHHNMLIVFNCVEGLPDWDIASYSTSDRMWTAHMLTYHLLERNCSPQFDSFAVDFIGCCLSGSTSPSRLVADCLLSAGLLIGLQVDRRHLARLDKRYPQFYCSLSNYLTALQCSHNKTARLNH